MANNQYNLSKEYQFDINVSADNYVGKLALPYVTAAVKSPDTVAKGYVRTIDGLNKAANISGLSLSDPVIAAACDFSTANTAALTQTMQTLTLKDMMVNESVCRSTVFPTWIGENMDRNGNLPSSFEDFLLATVAGRAGQQIENMIWQGASPFGTGFLSDDGTFDETGLEASACKSFFEADIATIAADNAITQFAACYDKAVAQCPGILSKPDIAFYVNNKTYGLYIQQLAGQGAFTSHQGINNLGPDQSFQAVTYLGIPIYVCPGIFDDAIVLTYRDNMVFGTNLATDWTEARVIPTYQYDGSNNVRVTMNFAIGVQTAVASDGVVGCTFHA
jgi:hypothetical protein